MWSFQDSIIEDNVIIQAGSTVGGDFSFYRTDSAINKVPQSGAVLIEKDTEIGSLCTINRASYDITKDKARFKVRCPGTYWA